MKTIYLAGGCFWGIEKYLSKINGVMSTTSGYANSKIENPSYQEVCSGSTEATETVKIEYNPQELALDLLLNLFFKVIDPTSLNRQGNDVGTQYRSGIYYKSKLEKDIIKRFIKFIQKNYKEPIMVEILELKNFYKAEEYHQNYLEKNPSGYCHINLDSLKKENKIVKGTKYKKPKNLLKVLTKQQYKVTQEGKTDQPFLNEYYNNKEKGIYVDIVTGEPIFLSTDKFDSGSGWPSFSKPIFSELVHYKTDKSFGMNRKEVISRSGGSHLGHLFEDGPSALGGLRYCINSSSLKFIPYSKLAEEGYNDFVGLLD